MNLKTIATFALGRAKTGTAPEAIVSLNIAQGSVLDFFAPSRTKKTQEDSSQQDSSPRVGAIVNAANVRCLGGGGVDGAISHAGGPNLWRDRLALPEISDAGNRCHVGGAVVTGPGRYGQLHVNYIVHAVGPAYDAYSKESDEDDSDEDGGNRSSDSEEFAKPDALLRSAYQEALERCRENGITDVGFSLLSAGIFRGKRSLDDVLLIGILAIRDWIEEQNNTNTVSPDKDDNGNNVSSSTHRLRSITLCGFSTSEVEALLKACRIVFEGSSSKKLKLSECEAIN